jgi:hypothetical protein
MEMVMNRNLARACVLAVVALPSLSHAATPPPWDDMLHDAKGVFERHRSDAILKKMVRAGEPKFSSRRTAVQLVPTVFQDVECLYQTKKFGQIERQIMTLHYEKSGLGGGWSFSGYSWADPETVREGKYPPKPAPPTEREIFDAVRTGMREWNVRPEHIEKVTPSGKPTFSWLDDVPTAGYQVKAKVSVRDVVDRTALYGARYKTRFLCDLNVQLALEDGVTWTMQGTVPDCADQGCSLQRICKDTWGNGASPKGGAPIAADNPPPRERERARDRDRDAYDRGYEGDGDGRREDRHASARRREPMEERPLPPPPRSTPPPPAKTAVKATTPPQPVKTGKLSSSGSCPAWQFATAATSGHCCWREQVWSDANRECIGIPKCPPGFTPVGTDCFAK